jgi:hypothetical protein
VRAVGRRVNLGSGRVLSRFAKSELTVRDCFLENAGLKGIDIGCPIGEKMKKRKLTQAALDAATRKAKKPSEPRTPERKRRSSQNAITHAFFARELALTAEEKQQLEALRRTLRQQLSPNTVMLEVAFEEVLTCTFRCRLALRQEMRHLSRTLDDNKTQQGQPDPAEGPAGRTEWYLSGRQGLREGMRLLEAVKQEFLNLGRIDEKWNGPLDQAFGPQLRQLVIKWMPSNPEAVMAGQQLIMHAERYNLPLPSSLKQEQSSNPDPGNTPQVILDPEQGKQMVIKLFDLEHWMLSDLWRSAEQRASDSDRAQNQAVDFTPRYFPSACRDLHRAAAWYRDLKKDGL